MIEALALAAALTAQSEPLDVASRNDLECVLATAVVLGALQEDPDADPQALMGLASGVTYFYGRLQGRAPGIDWFGYLAARPEMAEAVVADQAIFQRCAGEMQTMGQALINFGQEMGGQ